MSHEKGAENMRKGEYSEKWFGRINVFQYTLIGGVGLIVAYLVVPIIVTLMFHGGMYGDKTGVIGDTIGGIFGPLVGSVGVVLTFWAFWVQYQANQQQKRDLQIERFESRFFSMLETHRNNVAEIEVYNLSWLKGKDGEGKETKIPHVEVSKGRTAFMRMFMELKEIHNQVKVYHDGESYRNDGGHQVEARLVFETAYLIFFFGLGVDAETIVKDFWPNGENPLFVKAVNQLRDSLDLKQKVAEDTRWSSMLKLAWGDASLPWASMESFKFQVGDGHSEWLGHYYRQLFLMVDFLDSSPLEWMDEETKKRYARLLRSQLSTYEQLLLYYNALSALGQPWIEKNFLKTYGIVRSLPLPLADFYLQPKEVIGGERGDTHFVFDWLEIKERYKSKGSTTTPQD